MPVFDQRWIRKADKGYRSASGTQAICDSCGVQTRCFLPRQEWQCDVYVPVLVFQSSDGLHEPTWNTFRRGLGWYRRLRVGSTVRFWARDLEDFVAEGTVLETVSGALGSLMEDHAAMNHLALHHDWRERSAPELWKVLRKMYGLNFVAPREPFSVVYVELK